MRRGVFGALRKGRSFAYEAHPRRKGPSLGRTGNGGTKPQAKWQNRIVGEGHEVPSQLLANPANWRIHTHEQEQALATVLDRVGWVQRIIVNRTTGHMIDGHLRVALAISRNEPSVPVTYVALAPEEEALTLATLDPIAAMAGTDNEKLADLLRELPNMGAEVDALLAGLHAPRVGELDRLAEWEGMPEYEQEDMTGVKEITVHFAAIEDYRLFAEVVGQPLTDKTRSIWYPRQPILENSKFRYTDEP